MSQSVVRFPVTCPVCKQELLIGAVLKTVLHLLATDRPVKLRAQCARHKVVWVANAIERDQIQEYMDAVQLPFSKKVVRLAWWRPSIA